MNLYFDFFGGIIFIFTLNGMTLPEIEKGIK